MSYGPDDDEYLRPAPKPSGEVEGSREQQIDDYIDWDGGERRKNLHGPYFGRIEKRRAGESIHGYERRVGHEATLIRHPGLRREMGGVRLSQAEPREDSYQHCEWRAMMNQWLLVFVREDTTIDLPRLKRMLIERNRLARQCREMWGDQIPETRDIDVLGGMMRQLESVK